MQLLTDIVESKTVTLIGSAPNLNLTKVDSDILVSVNAAVLGVKFKLTPDITIFNTAFNNFKDVEYGIQTRKRLSEIKTKLLYIINLGNVPGGIDDLFEPIMRVETRAVDVYQRKKFLESFSGRPLKGLSGPQNVPSTGFLSCLLLLASGAKEIQMKGFSFHEGHSYLKSNQKRGHIEKDLELMNFVISNQYPVFFEDALIRDYNQLYPVYY